MLATRSQAQCGNETTPWRIWVLVTVLPALFSGAVTLGVEELGVKIRPRLSDGTKRRWLAHVWAWFPRTWPFACHVSDL